MRLKINSGIVKMDSAKRLPDKNMLENIFSYNIVTYNKIRVEKLGGVILANKKFA